MPSALIPTAEAIDAIVEMIRKRLTDARANGQKVRMTAKETARAQRFAASEPMPSFAQLLSAADKDGGFELSISIEPLPPMKRVTAKPADYDRRLAGFLDEKNVDDKAQS